MLVDRVTDPCPGPSRDTQLELVTSDGVETYDVKTERVIGMWVVSLESIIHAVLGDTPPGAAPTTEASGVDESMVCSGLVSAISGMISSVGVSASSR